MAKVASIAEPPRGRALPFEDYVREDATGLAAMARRGDVTASELLEAAMARAEAIDARVGAVVIGCHDLARAAVARGVPEGPFRGVPFLLKDLFTDLAGAVSTNGSSFHPAEPSTFSSIVVERYQAAGLVVFGKTHSPEFGGASTSESRLHGATRNPWRLDHIAGGSSGGAAAAVAAGIVPAAAASDAGGSIVIPASACGLFGLKPSRGRVPLGPRRFEGAGGLATQHALTRTVRDSAALLDVASVGGEISPIALPPPPASFLSEIGKTPGRLRIAVMTTSIAGLAAEPPCVAAVLATARLCEALGHHVEWAAPSTDVEAMTRAERSMRLASIAATVLGLEARIGRPATEADLEPATWIRYREGLEVTGAQILEARETMLAVHRDLDRFMARFELILSPSMAAMPPPIGAIGLDRVDEASREANRRCTTFAGLYNWTGQPSMSVPLHASDEGLPIGVLFAGRFGAEALLLRLAAQLERARPWRGLAPEFTP